MARLQRSDFEIMGYYDHGEFWQGRLANDLRSPDQPHYVWLTQVHDYCIGLAPAPWNTPQGMMALLRRHLAPFLVMDHPHIAGLKAVFHDGDEVFAVYELIRGWSLHKVSHALTQLQMRISLAYLAKIGVALCDALAYIHGDDLLDETPQIAPTRWHHLRRQLTRHRLLHSQLTTRQVYLTEDGDVKVAGYGLGQIKEILGHVQPGAVIMPNIQEMPPEQIRAEPMDLQSDIYMAGMLLYTLALGRSPFASSSHIGLLRKILEEGPPPFERLVPESPPLFASLINRAVHRDKKARYTSATEMKGALLEVLAICQDRDDRHLQELLGPISRLEPLHY